MISLSGEFPVDPQLREKARGISGIYGTQLHVDRSGMVRHTISTVQTHEGWWRHCNRIKPSLGRAYDHQMTPISRFHPKAWELIGDEWICPPATRNGLRQVIMDTNYWMAFIHRRLTTQRGDHGSLSIYGKTASGMTCWPAICVQSSVELSRANGKPHATG